MREFIIIVFTVFFNGLMTIGLRIQEQPRRRDGAKEGVTTGDASFATMFQPRSDRRVVAVRLFPSAPRLRYLISFSKTIR